MGTIEKAGAGGAGSGEKRRGRGKVTSPLSLPDPARRSSRGRFFDRAH